MYLCKQYITTITISFILIITVLEAKLINNIKQSNDHRVITSGRRSEFIIYVPSTHA
jgi:hypothetical protein